MNSATTSTPPAAGDPASETTGIGMVATRNFQHYEVLLRENGSPWELGRGTMGITYKALDTNLRSEVALKVVNSALIDHPNTRERFIREARAAAALRHRNVASVYHLGNDGEHFFYAMEFVDGETLDSLVRRQGPLPVGTALRLALQAARALAAAARQKLVHRDIKPANLMVAHEDADENMLLKVIDFGLARPTAGDGDESGAGSLTMHGFVGTPQYASPEQLEEHTLDARSDIYSLGVTLWFLLTGKAPFTGSLATICNQHLTKPPPWETLPASVPESVRRLLEHMLEKAPSKRPQDAVELRKEIEECMAVLHTPAPPAAAGEAPPAGVRGAVARLIATSKGFFGDAASEASDTESNPGPPPPSETSTGPMAGARLPRAADSMAEAGTILDDRFELLDLVGEGGSGRVFEARDRINGRCPVAVKILRSTTTGTAPGDFAALRDDARQVAAAPHANLVQLLTFEPARSEPKATPGYVAEEWVSGFNLRDLLAARNGAMPAIECLRLLGQAAAAADYAVRLRLERLELGLHQIHVHFPAPAASRTPIDHRALLRMSMEEWPEWILKIEAFGLSRDLGEPGTWAGEVTLLPGAMLHRGQAGETAGGSSLAETYLHALARIACELLGGQPPATAGAAGRVAPAKYVSLPTLTEGGNAVLARALSAAPGFETSSRFFETLASASGFTPDTLTPVAIRSFDPFPPAVPAAPAVPVAPARAADSSTEKTLLPPVSSSTRTVLPDESSRGGALPRRIAHDTDISGLHVGQDEADAQGDDDAGIADPWKESQIARLIEDEDERKFIDPHSTGFALAVGGVIGLVLLMVGFGFAAWRHESGKARTSVPAHAVASGKKQESPSASARKNPVNSPRPTATPAPARAVAAATPPPLAPGSAPAPGISPKPINPTPMAASAVAMPAASIAPPLPSPTPEVAYTVNTPPNPQPVISPEQASQRPDPTPRFNDKVVSVQVKSDPAGAEIFLEGASLGTTPLKATLPPGDYQLRARYRNWPEVRQDLHLAEDQTEAGAEIHLMSPSRVPLSDAPFSPVAENRRRRRRLERPAAESTPTAPAAPAVAPGASDDVPVARARAVGPVLATPGNPPPASAGDAPVRRALPALEPFVRRAKPVAPATPAEVD